MTVLLLLHKEEEIGRYPILVAEDEGKIAREGRKKKGYDPHLFIMPSKSVAKRRRGS